MQARLCAAARRARAWIAGARGRAVAHSCGESLQLPLTAPALGGCAPPRGARQIWQVLPLVPPDADYWSPYSGRDAHCGNPLLISLELLAEDGLLQRSELPPVLPVGAAEFVRHAAEAEPLLDLAALRLLGGTSPGARILQKELKAFRADPGVAPWLEDAALFAAIAHSSDALRSAPWWEWPDELRRRAPAALARVRAERRADIDRFCAIQFLFDRQWRRLKAYANARGVALVGDMPIYVGGHSADVWAHPQLWTLGADGVAGAVSGTPPDAFSETGQLWGSPLYDWPAHAAEGYRWWASRLGRALALHDEVRIDHFRGLAGYWSVPGDAPTALSGCWKLGPGLSFFKGIKARLGDVPLVAEDLGVITADVVALRTAIGAPGMAVLQFGWDGNPKNPHLPHNHEANAFVYPGTHDNETMAGWFAGASPVHRANFCAYLGTSGADHAWEALRMCMMSVARTVVVPMQDVLRLGNEARMNTPGVAAGNWAWRVGPPGVFGSLAAEAAGLRAMAAQYDRLAPGAPVVMPPPEDEAAPAAAAPAAADD